MASSFPSAKLVCIDSTQIVDQPSGFEIVLDKEEEKTVGRDESCAAFINSKKLSRKHARIFMQNNRWGIEDLNSTNGVYINGQKKDKVWPEHGDEIKFGTVSFEFLLDNPDVKLDEVKEEEKPAPAPAQTMESPETDEGEATMMFGALDAQVAQLRTHQARREVSVKKFNAKIISAIVIGVIACATAAWFLI